MSYQPLARKYRPGTLNEMVGQEPVTLALANSIKLGREPHGVIFSGVRGTGKTTLARIYAKALNCERGPTPEPCNACDSCVAITVGNHEDVLEIDGASNTGVDDVRSLRETVNYVAQRSKFKIYIIDEVHMLSQSAFNALLKTLEEPPAHVVFVFATTELQKIPKTILSRCQSFHLQKFSVAGVQKRLAEILDKEGVTYEMAALNTIAKEGHGSMRDALTLLDQAIALGEGAVTSATTQLVSGISSLVYIDLLAALVARDKSRALELVQKIDSCGAVEYADVVENLAVMARHGFIIRDAGRAALDLSLLDIDSNEAERLGEIGKKAAAFDLNRIFRTLVHCRSELDGSELDRFIFENYLLEWCLDPGLPLLDDLIAGAEGAKLRVSAPLQGATRAAQPLAAPPPVSSAVPPPAAVASTPSPPPSPPEAAVPHFPETWQALVERWKQDKPLQARLLEEVSLVSYGRDKIIVAVGDNSLAADKLMQKTVQQKIEESFAALFEFKGRFVVVRKEQQVLPESILEVKTREKQQQREDLVAKLQDDPFTKEAMRTFNATIDKVIVD